MTPQNMNKELNKISFTRHLLRCSITVTFFTFIFKWIGVIKGLDEVVNMLYWCIGWDLFLSYFSTARAYYLRSALAYCTIGLLICLLKVLGHHL